MLFTNRISLKHIIYFFVSVFIFAYLFIESEGKGDFYIYMSGAKDLFLGEDIYKKLYLDGYHYLYSVFFASILYPLSFLPFHLSKFLWLGTNVFFLYRIIIIIALFFDTQSLTKRQLTFFIVLSSLFSLRFVHENFHHGQMTICMLYLSLEGLRHITSGRKITGAFLIALGINIKLLPIVFVPYLLYRREFKSVFYITLFYGVLLFLPSIYIGYSHNLELLQSWWAAMNPSNTEHIVDTSERSFHGLSTLLATLFLEHVPDIYALPIKRNILSITIEQLSITLNLVRLILVAFTLYFLRTKPFKKATSKLHQYREVAYILLLIPLIFPHQQHYAFLFIQPAVVYVLYYLIKEKQNLTPLRRYTYIIILVVIYLTTNLKLILGEFNHYYEHFKILTYGAILLLILLALIKLPEKYLSN